MPRVGRWGRVPTHPCLRTNARARSRARTQAPCGSLVGLVVDVCLGPDSAAAADAAAGGDADADAAARRAGGAGGVDGGRQAGFTRVQQMLQYHVLPDSVNPPPPPLPTPLPSPNNDPSRCSSPTAPLIASRHSDSGALARPATGGPGRPARRHVRPRGGRWSWRGGCCGCGGSSRRWGAWPSTCCTGSGPTPSSPPPSPPPATPSPPSATRAGTPAPPRRRRRCSAQRSGPGSRWDSSGRTRAFCRCPKLPAAERFPHTLASVNLGPDGSLLRRRCFHLRRRWRGGCGCGRTCSRPTSGASGRRRRSRRPTAATRTWHSLPASSLPVRTAERRRSRHPEPCLGKYTAIHRSGCALHLRERAQETHRHAENKGAAWDKGVRRLTKRSDKNRTGHVPYHTPIRSNVSEEETIVVLLGSNLVCALLISRANFVPACFQTVVGAFFWRIRSCRSLACGSTSLESTIILRIFFRTLRIFIALLLAALACQPFSSRGPV